MLFATDVPKQLLFDCFLYTIQLTQYKMSRSNS